MVRKLKHHEAKLLKKVNFISDQSSREVPILRKYHIQRREDYTRYNRICGAARKCATKLSKLDTHDPFRAQKTEALLEKLYVCASGDVCQIYSVTSSNTCTCSSLLQTLQVSSRCHPDKEKSGSRGQDHSVVFLQVGKALSHHCVCICVRVYVCIRM